MWGTFSDPTYISVGDPYVDPRPAKLKQSKGVRQFQTGPTGTALGKKTKFARLFAGEKFVDFYQMKLAEKRQARSKQLSAPRPFTATVATHKMMSGSYNGCFGEMDKWMGDKVKEMEESEAAENNQKEEESGATQATPQHYRPIYTSPSKKGGFGVPGTLIGKPYQWKAAEEETNYSKKERLDHQAAVGDRAPFNASSKPNKTTFDEGSERVAASRIYSRDTACLQVPKATEADMTPKQCVEYRRRLKEKLRASEKAFIPTNPPKHGQIGSCFEPFPQYMEGEYVSERQKRANVSTSRLQSRAARQAEFNLSEAFQERKPFSAMSGPKSGPIKSVAIKRSSILRSIGKNISKSASARTVSNNGRPTSIV